MADIVVNDQYLVDLRKRLRELGSTCQALNNFFVIGADRLAREAEVAILQSLAVELKHQLELTILSEYGAQSAWRKASIIGDIGGLISNVIGSTPGEHPGVKAFQKTFTERQSMRQHGSGTIIICVGQGGLPDDVHVVSISELARIKNRVESEIIREIQQAGQLLFSPEVFLQMLDTVTEQLRRGELRLPIPPKQLPAKLAVPREIIVEFRLPFKAVPQLAPGRNMNTGGESNPPNITN